MLRLIHTSDWHLGATLHDIDRTEEHQAFLGWLAERAAEEEADALIVAGDVFDGANPSAEAMRLLCDFLAELRRRSPRIQVLLIGGNHDSAMRLEAPRELFSLAETRVVGGWPWREDRKGFDPDRLCLPLRDREGGIAAWVGAVPFLRPGDLSRLGERLCPPSEGEAEPPLGRVCREAYGAVLAALRERRAPGQAILLTGHLYASGGQLSPESERPIQRGHLDPVPAEAFPEEAAYVALGHLHLAQRVGGSGRIRYSGSPLPLSFSEVRYAHQVLSLSLEGERLVEVREVRIPRFRDLIRIPEEGPGSREEVLRALRALPPQASGGEGPDGEEPLLPLLEVRVRLDGPDPLLFREVEESLRDRAVRLARLERVRPGPGGPGEREGELRELGTLDEETVFLRLWAERRGGEGREEIDPSLLEEFRAVLEAVRRTEEGEGGGYR